MAMIKKYKWPIGIVIVLLFLLTIYIQYNKIERLKKKSALSEIDKTQATLVNEVIPQHINRIAPTEDEKAKLGDKLYGGSNGF